MFYVSSFMNSHSKEEKTLVLIKPDGVQRSLIGEIISRFERVGLKIIALKFFIPNEKQVEQQYGPTKEEIEALGRRSIENQKKIGRKVDMTAYEQGRTIIDRLKKYYICGPVVAMVLQGNQAVKIVKKIIGLTEPLGSDVGTIRGDYTIDSYSMADADNRSVRNLIHRSGLIKEAEQEIKIWFKEEEICKYKLIQEKILYDVNLDGIRE